MSVTRPGILGPRYGLWADLVWNSGNFELSPMPHVFSLPVDEEFFIEIASVLDQRLTGTEPLRYISLYCKWEEVVLANGRLVYTFSQGFSWPNLGQNIDPFLIQIEQKLHKILNSLALHFGHNFMKIIPNTVKPV